MLIDYVKDLDLVRCQVEAKDWIDVVEKGCKLLEDEGFITEDYAPSIIEMSKEHGPYYVLTPHVALPHSRPEAGVIKKGISVMTLANPIEFGNEDNDPVSLVICLAATDNKTHLDLMGDMVELLSDETNIENIIKAKNIHEILELLS